MIVGLHYTAQVVITMFLQDKGNLAPAAADIQQFDADVFANRDAALVKFMTANQIPTDVPTKSLILLYSNLVPGGTIEQMVESACQYFLNTRGF